MLYHVSVLHMYFIPSSLPLLILHPLFPFFASLFHLEPPVFFGVVFFFSFLYLWVYFCLAIYSCLNFPGGSSGKESTCQCRRWRRSGFSPWVGKIPWRRKWQPTPVFLPGEAYGQRSLAGYSPWGHKESDMTEAAEHTCMRVPQIVNGLCSLSSVKLVSSVMKVACGSMSYL